MTKGFVGNFLVNSVMSEWDKHSNNIKKCPFEKNKTYSSENIPIDDRFIPSIVRANTKFKFTFTAFTKLKKKFVLLNNVVLYGSLI